MTAIAIRRFLPVCVSVLLVVSAARADALPRGDAKEAGFAPDKLERIAAALRDAVEKKKIAGGSALVARRGKVVYVTAAGMQDVEAKVPVTESTIFRIASMSKPITSVAVMILVDEGKLSVTDPLSNFVPEFKEMKVLVPNKDNKSYELVKANREITIHDLLTHSSGITYGLIDKPFLSKMYAEAGVTDGLAEAPGTVGDNAKKLAKLPLACQPGAAWEYGLNTDVLGHIVESVSGKTLEEFFRERIFKPLKMEDTSFLLPKEKHARLSAIYTIAPDKPMTRVGNEPTKVGTAVFSATYPLQSESKYFSGGAGLVSTAGDYFRFCQMLLNRGELDGVRVLKAETVDRMTRSQLGELKIPFGGGFMGYGFGIVAEKGKDEPAEPGSYGWGGAFGTYFWVDPRTELIGVYMSQMFPPDFAASGEFKRLVYEAQTESKK